MPTFESIILSAPTGFVSGCSAILKLKIDDLTILIANILSKVKSGAQLDKQDPASRTIAFLAHARAQATPKPSATEVASTLDSNTVLTREIIAALVTSFDSSDTETVTLLTDTLKSGQLVDFKWRLGVAMSSSTCLNLSAPYVAISFAVRDSIGNKVYRSAELSYKEFQDFGNTFREVARVMDEM